MDSLYNCESFYLSSPHSLPHPSSSTSIHSVESTQYFSRDDCPEPRASGTLHQDSHSEDEGYATASPWSPPMDTFPPSLSPKVHSISGWPAQRRVPTGSSPIGNGSEAELGCAHPGPSSAYGAEQPSRVCPNTSTAEEHSLLLEVNALLSAHLDTEKENRPPGIVDSPAQSSRALTAGQSNWDAFHSFVQVCNIIVTAKPSLKPKDVAPPYAFIDPALLALPPVRRDPALLVDVTPYTSASTSENEVDTRDGPPADALDHQAQGAVIEAPGLEFIWNSATPNVQLSSSSAGRKRSRRNDGDAASPRPPPKKTRTSEYSAAHYQGALQSAATWVPVDVVQEDVHPVAGPSRRAEASRRDVVSTATDDESTNVEGPTHRQALPTDGKPKRSRRTAAQVLRHMDDMPPVHCPVPGCGRLFLPADREHNRAHLTAHHGAQDMVGSQALRCIWGCGTLVKGKMMVTHAAKEHIGRPFLCPAREPCGWRSDRSSHQSQHMLRHHEGETWSS
ncbi:hypothetical protein OH77DRAFT_621778 [Trametes cingulata]|nr:hypothetical protein OH77DRAFT_621778 [Trametes cingulata]